MERCHVYDGGDAGRLVCDDDEWLATSLSAHAVGDALVTADPTAGGDLSHFYGPRAGNDSRRGPTPKS